jgi:hypothetical protein
MDCPKMDCPEMDCPEMDCPKMDCPKMDNPPPFNPPPSSSPLLLKIFLKSQGLRKFYQEFIDRVDEQGWRGEGGSVREGGVLTPSTPCIIQDESYFPFERDIYPPMMTVSKTPRHPGGQPGNLNALKHGFYTRRIHKRHLSGVENTNIKGLAEEIALIRIFTRRLIESGTDTADLYELAGILRTICLASTTITRIIKAQAFLVNDPSNFYQEVDQAIRQVRLEMGLDCPPEPPAP